MVVRAERWCKPAKRVVGLISQQTTTTYRSRLGFALDIFSDITHYRRLGLILSGWTPRLDTCARRLRLCCASTHARSADPTPSLTPRRSLQMRTATIQHSASGNETMSGEVSDPACAAVLDAFAHMLVARTLSRAASLNPRASVLPHTQQMNAAMIQHSARDKETKSGEVSDPGCSRPAAAVLDARARMLVARILSRAASLTPCRSVMRHTADAR